MDWRDPWEESYRPRTAILRERAVEAAVSQLPETIRWIVILGERDGLSSNQIAILAGVSPEIVQSMQDRGRALVQTKLLSHTAIEPSTSTAAVAPQRSQYVVDRGNNSPRDVDAGPRHRIHNEWIHSPAFGDPDFGGADPAYPRTAGRIAARQKSPGGYVSSVFKVGVILAVIGFEWLIYSSVSSFSNEVGVVHAAVEMQMESEQHIPLTPMPGAAVAALGLALVFVGRSKMRHAREMADQRNRLEQIAGEET